MPFFVLNFQKIISSVRSQFFQFKRGSQIQILYSDRPLFKSAVLMGFGSQRLLPLGKALSLIYPPDNPRPANVQDLQHRITNACQTI